MSIEMNPVRTSTVRPVRVETSGIGLSGIEVMAGVKAGAVAAYTMGLVAMVVVWIHNWSTWMPFNDVAGIILPTTAQTAGVFNPLAVLIGVGVHFGVSVLLGVGFALLCGRLVKADVNSGVPVLVGFGFGLGTWLVARLIMLPMLGSEIYAAPSFLVAHLIFGATLGLLYPMMLARRHKG